MVNAKLERLLIKFTKNNEAKFISHLDTLRTLHRAFRRSELPISYSKGFNPHASISVAAPLSLGIESNAEYADVEINDKIDSETIKKSLNESLPGGIKILKVIEVSDKMPASMAAVDYAKYSITFKEKVKDDAAENLVKSIIDSSEIVKMKRTKSGEKLVNIRTFISELYIEKYENDFIRFDCILKTGSKGSLGSEAIADLIKEYSNGEVRGHSYIIREEIYTDINDKKVPLDRYYSGK